MAVALSEPLGGSASAPAVTISLSPFAYAAARDSSMIGDRRSYSRNGTLRRAAASVTIGGPLQSRDPSKAAQASNATNHVTTELKLRMVGSRDRREHPEKFHAAIDTSGLGGLAAALAGTSEFRVGAGKDVTDSDAYGAYLAALRNHPYLGTAVLRRLAGVTRAIRAFNDEIDRAFLLSLGLTADTYATGFGRDLYVATLVAEFGRPLDITLNAGYRSEEAVHTERHEELKLGAGVSWRLFRSSSLAGPLEVTLDGCGLIRNQNRASVWLGSVKLDFPLDSGLKLTTSLTVSTQPERPGEGIQRGSFGLSYDLMRSPP